MTQVLDLNFERIPANHVTPATKFPSLHPLQEPRLNPEPSPQHVDLEGFAVEPQEKLYSLLERYGKAIANFTGSDDIAFSIFLDTTEAGPIYGIAYCAFEPDAKAPNVKLYQVSEHVDSAFLALDFSICIDTRERRDSVASGPIFGNTKPLADVCFFSCSNHLCLTVLTSLQVKFTVSIKRHGPVINISYDANLIPSAATPHLINGFASALSLKPRAVQPSVVNYPPTTYLDNDPPLLLHTAFERQAAATPDTDALDFLGSGGQHTVLTYAELDGAAETLARKIVDAVGAPARGKADIIPFYLAPSPELYVAYLGILKAGYGFCPLPLDAPDERLRDILDDLSPKAVLHAPTAGGTPPKPLGDASLLDITAAHHAEATRPPNHRLRPASHSIAYAMYTSGSTGKPKGVQIPHTAAAASIASNLAALPLAPAPTPRWFQFISTTFDPSLVEIFGAWARGATLCSAPRALALSDPEGTATALRASAMLTVPSVAGLLRAGRMPYLRDLVVMGECVGGRVVGEFCAERSGVRLVNGYGPTEATINCTLVAFRAGWRGSVIGPPLRSASLFVLGPSGEAVPLGWAGELAIGGPQLSVGYLNRPRETAAAFVESAEYGRVYRTGDKARMVWDEEGNLMVDFLGRISAEQVKLDGRRVEMGEIEGALTRVQEVAEVAVAAAHPPDGQSGLRVVALLVPAAGQYGTKMIKECQHTAASLLPLFMRPSHYEILPSLPRLSSGKVDRKSVQAIAEESLREILELTPPVSSTADSTDSGDENVALLCQLISDVIDIPRSRISPSSDLLSLGLDSLRTMSFLQKARDHGITGLSVGEALQCRTVAAVAALLRQKSSDPAASLGTSSFPHQKARVEEFGRTQKPICAASLQVPGEQIEAVFPVTTMQADLLTSFVLSESLGSETRPYMYHSVFALKQSTDVERLVRSWNAVLKKHDVYRSVFVAVEHELAPFAQCVLAPDCAKAQVAWRRREVEDVERLEELVADDVHDVERHVSLEAPPLALALLSAGAQRALVVSLFHGIFDAGTVQMLMADVNDEYHGRQAAVRSSLETAVDLHFLADREEADAFWAKSLEGVSPPAFPSLTGLRPEARTNKAEVLEHDCSVTLSQVRDGAKTMGGSTFSLIEAAWTAILSSYCHSADDVVFGAVFSGRYEKEVEVAMAPTLAILPMRMSTASVQRAAVRQVIRELALKNAKAMDHLQARDTKLPDGRIAYDTVLTFQEFRTEEQSDKPWESVKQPAMANDLLMLEVWPTREDGLRLRVSFTDAHMNQEAADVMLREFDAILQHLLSNPDAEFAGAYCVGDSSLLSIHDMAGGERERISQDPRLLHTSQFERWVQETPDADALVYIEDLSETGQWKGANISFSEANTRAEDLAAYLQDRYGDLRGVYVPMMLRKSPAVYLGLLGILKAGGAWCPVDPDFPPNRRSSLVRRTGAPMVLVDVDTEVDDSGIPDGIEVIRVSRLAEPSSDIPSRGFGRITPTTTPEDPAYLIWTSGTTGAPKGVPIHHRAAVSSMESAQRLIPGNADASQVRTLQFAQYVFDLFVQDVWYTWGLGGAVVTATKDLLLSSYPEVATAAKATHANMTPAFAKELPRASCPTLKVLTFIGEKLPQDVADEWSVDSTAFNTYGPAEATVLITVRQFSGPGADCRIWSSNIGWAMPSAATYVLRDDRPVMRNAVGELALAGPQVSKGYLDTPERTAKAFVWNEALQTYLYKTGDMARQLADGSIDFLGRTDDLVKLGGIRVELSEIEMALRGTHPAVHAVSVQHLARSETAPKVLVAYLAAPSLRSRQSELVVATDEAASVARAVLDAVRKSLPEFMIPSTLLVLKNMPHTRSAKIDRDALRKAYETADLEAWESLLDPSQAQQRQQQQQTQQRTRSPAIAWSGPARYAVETLALVTGDRVENISPSARLRSIGIDSIGAVRLARKFKTEGHDVSVRDVMASNTVADLAALFELKENKVEEVVSDRSDRLADFQREWEPRLRAAGVHGSFLVAPPLPLQEALLSETARHAGSYWSSHFFKLSAEVEAEAVLRAWSEVVRRSEALRLSFFPVAELDGPRLPHAFLQFIHQNHDPFIDAQHLRIAPGTLQQAAQTRADAVAVDRQQHIFRRPLSAFTIFDDGETRHVAITVHHSVHDNQGLHFIFDDLCHAYGGASPLAARPQWHDALALCAFATADGEQDAARFWSEQLAPFAGGGALTLPDLSGCRNPPRINLTHTLPLTVSLTRLQDLCRRQLGAGSAVSVVRAAFGCTLAEYLEADAVFFGESFSERIHYPDLSDVVGPLLSVMPVVVSRAGTVRDVITQQAKMLEDATLHRHVHPRALKRIVGCPASDALYCAVFQYHPEGDDLDDGTGDLPWKAVDSLIPLNVEHPLAINVQPSGEDGLECTFECSSSVMNSEQLELFARQVDTLVSAMVESPDTSIAELSDQFPQDLMSITIPCVTDEILAAPLLAPTRWLDHWAEHHPDWKALVIAHDLSSEVPQTSAWTYRELSEFASRVAGFIQAQHVSKRNIAVCLGRSFVAYAVVAGIWKSGNCYLPIAEDLPEERRALLLRDSGAALFFTESNFLSSLLNVPDGCRVVNVESVEFVKEIQGALPQKELEVADPDGDCYLLYTSGSTGTPKGVVVTRGDVSAFTEAWSDMFAREVPEHTTLGGVGKWLAHASRAFDVHIAEMVLAWRSGLATTTAPRAALLDNLRGSLAKLHITHVGFVPSLVDQAGLEPEHVPDLRYLGVGGEKMSQRIIDCFASSDQLVLVNTYGPTEATVGITANTVKPTTNVRNIGKTIGNTVVHVLEPDSFRYTKKGQAGELCVTGDLVAKGYYQRPDAKGFVDFNGSRMYRTGDIVRLMADGSIEFLGRRDNQAKIRGQRLELEEVSECVRKYAGEPVDVTSVVLPHPTTGRPHLVSFLGRRRTGEQRRKAEPAFIREDYQSWVPRIIENCKRVLPAYMVPAYIIPLTYIPIQISGKANVRQLTALYTSIPRSELIQATTAEIGPISAPAAPRALTEAETRVRDVLASVLEFDATVVSAETNIFDLGLDSLSAIDVSIKMKKAGYVCSVADVLSHALISQLAALPRREETTSDEHERHELGKKKLEELEQSFRDEVRSSALPNSSVEAVRPCLPLQESIVANSLNDDSKSLYVNHIALKLAEDVDPARLKDAWIDLLHSASLLRTCFAPIDDAIVQIVLKPRVAVLPWSRFDLTDEESAHQRFRSKQSAIAAEIIENMQTQPPFRLLVAIPPQSTGGLLFISIHHSLYDGDTMGLLLDALYSHYHGLRPRGEGDVTSLFEYLSLTDMKAAKKAWKQHLSSHTPTHTVPSSSRGTDELSVVETSIKPKLSELSAYVAQAKVTLSSLMEGIFAAALAQLVGQNDVIFGTVFSGRSIPIPSAESLLLPLVTTVPTRIQFDNRSTSLKDVVSAAHRARLDLMPFQHVPLRQIQRWAQADGPLFDCLFSLTRTSKKPDYSSILSEQDSSMAADYPLAVDVEANSESDTITLRVGTAKGLGIDKKARALLETMDLLIHALVNEGDASLQSLGIQLGSPSTTQTKEQRWSEATWSPKEQLIRKVTSDICGISPEQVTKNASFFALGLDSVTAINFAKALRNQGLNVSSADVMRHNSIGALANHAAEPSVDITPNGVGIEPAEMTAIELCNGESLIEDTYLCTPLQTSMITQTLASDGKLYLHHHAAILAPDTDLEHLKDAWTRLVDRTDILRTSFHQSPTQRRVVAAVHKGLNVDWDVIDVADPLPEALNNIAAHYKLATDADFQHPPVRATVLRSPTSSLFVLTMHHGLYDGYSVPLIFHDLALAYEKNTLPTRPPFAPAAKHIALLHRSACNFWIERLDNYRKAEVPTQMSDVDSLQSLHQVEIKLRTPAAALVQGCASIGITLQTAALLAFGKALMSVVQQRDVAFGHVVSGRFLDVEGAEDIIGPLFNTVPLRVRLDQALQTNRDAAQRMQQFAADAQPYQHASLSEIQKAWRQRTGDNSPRLFDALFLFNKADETSGAGVSDLFKPFEPDQGPEETDFPINFEVLQGVDAISVAASSKEAYLDPHGLKQFVGLFEEALEDILTNPERSAMAVPSGLKGFQLVKPSPKQQAVISRDHLSGSDVEAIRLSLAENAQVPPESVGLDTSIFALGIDSMVAIQTVAACRKNGLALSVVDILQGGSIRGIIDLVRRKKAISPEPEAEHTPTISSEARGKALSLVRAPSDAIEAVVPALSGQIFSIVCWLQSGRTLYEPTWTFTSSVKLDAERLSKAWQDLRTRHSILRTAFAAVSTTEVLQVVLKASWANENDRTFESVEVSGGYSPDRLIPLVKEIQRHPSDLTTPPVRLSLVRYADKDAVLLTLHHAVYDATTIPILLADLADLYRGTHLPSPTPSFSAFSDHVARTARAHRAAERAFWSHYLSPAIQPTILGTPANKSRDPHRRPRDTFLHAPALIPQLATLDTACRRAHVTTPAAILLAFARVLARASRARDPCFGFYTAGRSGAWEGVSGPTVNLLPLVVRGAAEGAVARLVRGVNGDLAGRAGWEGSGLREVLGGDALPFNVFVNLVWQADKRPEGEGKGEAGLFDVERIGVPVDFASEVALEGETAVGALETGWFPRSECLYVDLGRDWEGDAIDAGARYEGEGMGREDIQGFLAEVAEEVRAIREAL